MLEASRHRVGQLNLNQNTISIVIPVYNGQEFIEQAMESIESQILAAKEVIVVDDCSNDNSAQVISDYISKSNLNISLVSRNINSGGPSAPINHGISMASGHWILILDQDDQLAPTCIQNWAEALAEHPEAGVVVSKAVDIDTEKSCTEYSVIEDFVSSQCVEGGNHCLIGNEEATLLPFKFGMYPVGYPGFIFKKALWQKQRIDEGLRIAGDLDFFLYLSSATGVILSKSCGFLKRRHNQRACNDLEQLLIETNEVFTRHYLKLPCSAQPSAKQYVKRRLLNAFHHFQNFGFKKTAANTLRLFDQVERNVFVRFLWRLRYYRDFLARARNPKNIADSI